MTGPSKVKRERKRTVVNGRYPVQIGPFREWLAELLTDMTREDVAQLVGVDERRVRDWLTQSRTIHFDALDRAFCQAGQPHLLHVLYPRLDEEIRAYLRGNAPGPRTSARQEQIAA